MSMWWSLHLRREAASVPLARRLLVGTMETAGVDPEISYDLSVALSEACANAVEHGGDSSTGYLVTAFIDGDTCRIEVTDSGPGFPEQPRPRDRRRTQRPARATRTRTPAPAQDEHGRGLFLIESLTDHVRVRNRPGRQGAVVSFDKILKWREGALLKAS
ncbi:ATP-binding protein [Streptomyces albireticuli]|uniref:ATP-binding protein n=1 Tax=Streptomyces albireticuli TaxID=1940 RepID=UPI001E3A391B|nr:ATP-binding protein [Streptomyces albireticuli]MCD9143694.1 ATP-binding protein [Streptomyces albireticuli]MCD9161875.1 ATP-binding protein [Streptomyces albireticuli]MCD9191811.1 ATP-binding protein [Streptomyces albireticuli]